MAKDRRKSKIAERGRKRGYVTLDEIVLNSPPQQSAEQVEELLEELDQDGIDVVGLDGEAERPRKRRRYHGSESTDPVSMYMRQLKSVPLLSKKAEVDTAKRLESGRLDLLRAALNTSIAVSELIRLAQEVRKGNIKLRSIIDQDPLDAQEEDDADRDDGESSADTGADAENLEREERERFFTIVANLQNLDREQKLLEDKLRSSRVKDDEQRKKLAKQARDLRAQMLDQLMQLDFQEAYAEAVVARIKRLTKQLEQARTIIGTVEGDAGLSLSQLRKLLRERRKTSKAPGIRGVATIELPSNLALSDTHELNLLGLDISDPDLAEYVRRLKNSQREIRKIEREARATSDQLLKAYRKIVAAERRCQRAKEELVLANQRLVVHIASKYANRGLPFLELVQEGNLGLMRAVEKFDYRRGYKFSTYGTWWIRHAISRAIANQTRTIRLPVHIRDAIRRIIKESQRHVLEMGREPTTDEIAERLEMPHERVVEIMEASRKTLRWELPVGEDGETELGTLIADEAIPSPFETVSNRGQWAQIGDAMESLRDRERDVLRRRFGLDGSIPQTLEQVGKDLGITRERVRQIQARAIRKLQLAVRAANRRRSV